MGLGLAASSLICKALGGELHLIRSEENEGSKFEFTMKVELGQPIVRTQKNLTVSSKSHTFNERGQSFLTSK
jgi:hypothetical protein